MKTVFAIALLLPLSLPMPVWAVTGQLFENEETAKAMLYDNLPTEYADIVWAAEQNATGAVKDVLYTARVMTLDEQFVIKGGCWDYLNAVFNRAGVPSRDRKVVYKTTQGGSYAKLDELQAGDWLYHVNYGYRGIEHSGLFIGWIDKDNGIGLTLSYAGESRGETARYRAYDLTGVYQIMRTPS